MTIRDKISIQDGAQASAPQESIADTGDTDRIEQPLRFTHACATRPSEWPRDAHLVLAMRRPRWRVRLVLDAGGWSMPAAGPSDHLLNAYLGKVPRGARAFLGGTSEMPVMPSMSWDEFAASYRMEMRTPEGLSVLDEIIGIAQQDPEHPLAVLCWERLDGPNAHAHCHRTVLVELLEERARELGIPTMSFSAE